MSTAVTTAVDTVADALKLLGLQAKLPILSTSRKLPVHVPSWNQDTVLEGTWCSMTTVGKVRKQQDHRHPTHEVHTGRTLSRPCQMQALPSGKAIDRRDSLWIHHVCQAPSATSIKLDLERPGTR